MKKYRLIVEHSKNMSDIYVLISHQREWGNIKGIYYRNPSEMLIIFVIKQCIYSFLYVYMSIMWISQRWR